MKRTRVVFLCAAVACVGLAQTHGLAQRPSSAPASTQKPRPATPRKAPAPAQPLLVSSHAASQDHTAVVRKYCATCHSEKGKAGGLSLAAFDIAHAAQNAEVAEKIVRKLQAGFMPPPLA